MGPRFARLLASSVIAAALAAGTVGAAFAADGDDGTAQAPPPAPGPRLPVPPSSLAEFFGLTTDQVRADLRSGESLAQIADAQAESTADLEAFIQSEAKEYLDQAVAAGRITADQETQRLAGLADHVDDVVNRTPPPRPNGPPPPPASRPGR